MCGHIWTAEPLQILLLKKHTECQAQAIDQSAVIDMLSHQSPNLQHDIAKICSCIDMEV